MDALGGATPALVQTDEMLWVVPEPPPEGEPAQPGWGAPLWLARATAPQSRLSDPISVEWFGAFKNKGLKDDMTGSW